MWFGLSSITFSGVYSDKLVPLARRCLPYFPRSLLNLPPGLHPLFPLGIFCLRSFALPTLIQTIRPSLSCRSVFFPEYKEEELPYPPPSPFIFIGNFSEIDLVKSLFLPSPVAPGRSLAFLIAHSRWYGIDSYGILLFSFSFPLPFPGGLILPFSTL